MMEICMIDCEFLFRYLKSRFTTTCMGACMHAWGENRFTTTGSAGSPAGSRSGADPVRFRSGPVPVPVSGSSKPVLVVGTVGAPVNMHA